MAIDRFARFCGAESSAALNPPSWSRYGRVVTADPASHARIEKAVTAVRQWATLAGTPQTPAPGSQLAGDDLVFPALPTSTVTWYAITSAIDHLDLGADLLQADNVTVLRPHAFFSLTRSALLGAAQALWVLSGSPEERAVRSLLIVEDEAANQRRYLNAYLGDPTIEADVSNELLASMRANVDRLSTRIRTVRAELGRRGHRGRFESTAMIKDVALHMAPGDVWLRRAVMDQWQRGSAAAHGRMWTLHFRESEEIQLPDGGVARTFSSSVEDVAQAYGAPTLILSEALDLWEQNTRAPRAIPILITLPRRQARPN